MCLNHSHVYFDITTQSFIHLGKRNYDPSNYIDPLRSKSYFLYDLLQVIMTLNVSAIITSRVTYSDFFFELKYIVIENT